MSCCRKWGPALTNAKVRATGTSLTQPLPNNWGRERTTTVQLKASVPEQSTRLVYTHSHQQQFHFSAHILCPSSKIYLLITFLLACIDLELKFTHQKVKNKGGRVLLQTGMLTPIRYGHSSGYTKVNSSTHVILRKQWIHVINYLQWRKKEESFHYLYDRLKWKQ